MWPLNTHMPVLVSGATGFVGEHLTRRLAAENRMVTGLCRLHSLAVSGVSVVRVDLRQRDVIRRLIGQLRPGFVFHCAAETDVAKCQQDPVAARGHIVDATRHLTQAVADLMPEAVVVALSTDLVFDGEQAPYRACDLAEPLSVYGRLKLEAEHHVLSLPRGLVLRTSLVYGQRATHKASFLGWMVDTLACGEPLDLFEDEVRTPLFVQDLCDAMTAMADRGQTGLWHVGGQRLNRVEIGRAVCRACGFDPGLIRPKRLVDSTYPAPRARDVSLDSTPLWSFLGVRPLALADALPRIVRPHGLGCS